MTTQANPDGTTQQPASEPAAPAGEEWRNKDEVKRIIAKRDEAANAAKAEKARADALAAELADIKAAKMKADGDVGGLLNSEKARADAAEAREREASEKLAAVAKNERRREIVDAILSAANPQVREDLRLMLAGFNESGEIDLYAEDAKAEGKRALEKLRKRLPAYFAPSDAGNGASPRGPGRDYSDVDWMQLTPQEQREVSPEDFKKHFAGRGAGRRGRGSALFGNATTTPRK